jgi:AmiR/NasT family two-component response regulator
MLAAGAGLDMEEAFRRLRRYARNHGYRLDEVARRVVAGELAPEAL